MQNRQPSQQHRGTVPAARATQPVGAPAASKSAPKPLDQSLLAQIGGGIAPGRGW